MLIPPFCVLTFLSFGSEDIIMKTPLLVIVIILIIVTVNPLYADDDSRYDRYWQGGEWKEEYRDSPCEVKMESKPGESKREIKCKDGIGASWYGEWKKEFTDGRCKIKQEAKIDEFKEEVKCD
jgi:hypothetical protein